MTTPYGISVIKGSQTFQGYVNAPISGPLNSNQYPKTLVFHSYGLLNGKNPTPPQFFSGQVPVNSDMSIICRRQYVKATHIGKEEKIKQDVLGKTSSPIKKVLQSTQRSYMNSSHMNYVAPISGGMFINVKKSIAVGKSSYKVGLPLEIEIGTKSYDNNFRRAALQRARSGGCGAPKKKGSIYNYSLTQPGINGWGSIPKMNY